MSNDMPRDFNNIKEWLLPHIDRLEVSVEQLANRAGLSKAALYFWMEDKNRPSEQNMARLCHALGVPLEEGLRQYTPKKAGRPKGSK